MPARKAKAFFTIEIGRFGWGCTEKATLPRQREFCFIRISFGPGSIDEGIVSQIRHDGIAPPTATARRHRCF